MARFDSPKGKKERGKIKIKLDLGFNLRKYVRIRDLLLGMKTYKRFFEEIERNYFRIKTRENGV